MKYLLDKNDECRITGLVNADIKFRCTCMEQEDPLIFKDLTEARFAKIYIRDVDNKFSIITFD